MRWDDQEPQKDKSPQTDLYYLLCPHRIPAYILSARKWGYVSIDKLSDVHYDADAFTNLVLEPSVKMILRALVGKFASKDGQISAWPPEFLRNKAARRRFLLSGPPGVGKTHTAECVAELARRPLLSIYSDDLKGCFEKKFASFLALGERYGAVIVLDEAHLYLEARDAWSLERNALIGHFIQAQDCYRGVLFLSTVSERKLDPGVLSRIQMWVHCRRLTEDARRRIWTNQFAQLERASGGADQVQVGASARAYVYMNTQGEDGATGWSGRDIESALAMAMALAEAEAGEDPSAKVCIEEKHLRQVTEVFRDMYPESEDSDDSASDGSESDDSDSECACAKRKKKKNRKMDGWKDQQDLVLV